MLKKLVICKEDYKIMKFKKILSQKKIEIYYKNVKSKEKKYKNCRKKLQKLKDNKMRTNSKSEIY